VTEKMIVAVLEHGLLSIAFAVAYWYATPHLIKKTLSNGGGAIIQGHIKLANAEQSIETAKVIDSAIVAHEGREARMYGSTSEALVLVRENVAALGAKLEAHLARRPA
jgi:hypothetical protein